MSKEQKPLELKAVREKAKKFVIVNKLSPLGLYALNLSVVAFLLMLAIATPVGWFVLIPLIFYYVMYAPVIYSSADFYLRSYNLKLQESFKFFEGFKLDNFLRSLILHLLFTAFGSGFIIAFVVGVLVAVFNMIWVGILIGLGIALVYAVPAGYIFARSSFAYYFLRMDAKISSWRSIKRSFEATKAKGRTTDVLKLFGSYLGWYALGIVTAGLGFIYAVPHYQTAKSIYFRENVLQVDENVSLKELSERLDSPYAITGTDDEFLVDSLAFTIKPSNGKQSAKQKNIKSREIIGDDFDKEVVVVKELIAKSGEPSLVARQAAVASMPLDIDGKSLEDDELAKGLEIRAGETFTAYRERVGKIRARASANETAETSSPAQALVGDAAIRAHVDTIPVQIINSLPTMPEVEPQDNVTAHEVVVKQQNVKSVPKQQQVNITNSAEMAKIQLMNSVAVSQAKNPELARQIVNNQNKQQQAGNTSVMQQRQQQMQANRSSHAGGAGQRTSGQQTNNNATATNVASRQAQVTQQSDPIVKTNPNKAFGVSNISIGVRTADKIKPQNANSLEALKARQEAKAKASMQQSMHAQVQNIVVEPKIKIQQVEQNIHNNATHNEQTAHKAQQSTSKSVKVAAPQTIVATSVDSASQTPQVQPKLSREEILEKLKKSREERAKKT